MPDLDDAILTVACDPGDATYIRRRDVRLYLVTAGNQAAWVALRNHVPGFEASDYFSTEASEDMSSWYREQAFTMSREGVKPELDEARQRFLARRKLDGPDPSRKRKA